MANMAKTNKLSKIFVVLLFVVVAVALTFAFVNVPIGAANAEGDVLEGQTAEYDIDLSYPEVGTDKAFYYSEEAAKIAEDSVWSFSVEANTYHTNVGETASRTTYTNHMQLKVKTAGIIKFEYNNSITSLNSTLYFRVWKNDDSSNYEVDVKGAVEDYVQVELDVQKDDVVNIEAQGQYKDRWRVHGLKKPTNTFEVTATIVESDRESGTVSIGDQNSEEGVIKTQVDPNKTVTIKAKPNSGYFAFWQDSNGKVVCRDDIFTTPEIKANTDYFVRFEKYVSAGADGQAKITYDSTLDETADFGWKKSDTEGRYELTDIKYFATGNNVHTASAPGILTLTLTFDGEKAVSFDYLLERAMQKTNGEIIDYPQQLLRLYFIVDGEGVTTESSKAEPTGEEEFWSEPYNYKFEKGSTGLKETAAVTDEQAGTGATTSIEAMIKGEGHHKVEFVIVSMLTVGVPFYKDVTKCYVENIQVKDPTPHTFTLDYDDALGNIAVKGAKQDEGNSWTGYDGFPITFEASTTEVESSLDKKTQVPTHFINWTVGDSQPTDTTLNLMFKDGKLTYGDKELTANEVKALFQEETIKPTAFRQITNGTSDTQQITDGEEVKLPINEAPETQLRLITAGFGKENEEIVLKVNGANTNLQTVKRNDSLGELGDLVTEEILSNFNEEVQDLKWWVQPNLGKQLVLEVAYTCNGYFGESILTMYLTYTADTKDLGLSNNSLNNVFTSDSEDGAYITTINSKGEGDELWSATNEWEGDNGSIVFENNLHNINNLEQYSPGITSGQDRDKFWYYSYVRIGISQNDGAKRKGVLMFDIRLDITGGNGDRKGAVVVERRDYTGSNGPGIFKGTDVDYTPPIGLSYKDGTFNRSCITSVLEYTNKTQIWGMNNPYVTDLGDGWYRCAFPTVRECDYLSEDDSYTHDTLQYFISFGFSGDVSARYAIRNMTFRNGTDAEFKFNANDPQNNGNVTAKVGESSISSGRTVAFGSRVELTATATDGQKFYGWEIIDKEKKSTFYASTSASGSEYKLSYTVLDPVTVVAWFGSGEAYEARVGGHFYATLDDAVQATKSLGTADIVIVKDKIHLASDLEIPAGISLILPFSDEGLYFGSAASNKYKTENRIAWADGDENDNKYLTFFIDNTATLTVKGNFFVGGVVNHVGQGYQGHTSGAYAEVINNGHIVIQDKGVMDVYGRVRGTGDIDVQSGDLKQPFLILDFMGGTETLGLFMDGVTPFKRYAMINIECKFTIHYGARLVGHATLYALNQFISLDQAFIGMSDDYGRDTMIMLKDGAYVTATYNPNKIVGGATSTNCTEKIGETTLHFYGGAWFSYMQFTAMGITVPTSGVFFSIPYNYNLHLDVNGKEEGTYETKTDFMIMPGAVVHVCEKAKLILHSNAWIYDGFEQATVANKSYPTASDLENSGYSKSGNLIVDGTLEIQKKFGLNNSTALPDQSNLQAAIFVGLVQTTSNTGKIVIDSQAILTFRPFDGTEGPSGGNYFAYNSTARVWDAAHGCFADLEAGKTYTAVKGKEGNDVTFTLDSIKYTNTKESETDELTLILNQQLHGSWMEVHEGHQLDWTPNEEKDEYSKLGPENLHKLLSRQCSVMGCDHTEEKELLYAISAFGDVTYKGAVYSEEDLLALLKALFEKEPSEKLPESFKAAFKANNGAILKDAQDGYEVVVTLENAYWLVGEQYQSTNTLTLNIKPKDVKVTLTAQGCVYGETAKLNDTAFTINGKCGDDVIGLKLKFKDGATPHDAGAYTFVIEQGSNTNKNYNITNISTAEGTFTVQKMEIEVTLPSYNREYNGNVPEVGDLAAATANKALGYEDKLEDLITLELNGADKNVGKYDVTAKINGQTADNEDKNYKYTFKNGTYEITKKKVTVTAEDKQSEFGKQIVPLTFKVNTLVDGENINDFIKISTDATQDSPVGSNYTITVEWKDESRPQNYEVTQFNNGHYTIVAAGFGAITFDEVNVTYDGKPHTPKMNGAPEGASVTYKLKKGEQYTEPFTSATNAATYELQATVSLANYESQDITLTLTINKRAITVDLPSKTRAYDGTVPQASELEPTLHTDSTLGEGDKLEDIVELSIENAAKDVKDYAVKGTQKTSATNYTVNFGNDGTYKITQANVTVKIQPQTKVYDGKVAELAQDKWEKTSGDWAQGVAPKIVLKFASSADVKNFGTYDIEGECTDSNYKVEFTDGKGAYSIAKRSITVAAENKQSTYGDAQVELSYSVTGNEDISDDASIQVKLDCSVNAQSPYNEDGYPITVTVLNKESLTNYDVHEVNGTYTVNKKDVTVIISDQNATYNFEGKYDLDQTKWDLAEGQSLANGETKDVLKVKLARVAITKAGEYAITATYTNSNYNVKFEGSWANDDENKGKAGTYTVAKKHVVEDGEKVMFTLLVDGEEYQGTEVFPYVGENFELTAMVFVLEGEDDYKELAYTIDPAELTEVKIYTVTVTINDDNYEGSREFTVEVVTDDGFSQNLKNVLAELERIVGDVTKDTLSSTQEHFDMIKEIEEQLAKLTETDKELGAAKLAKYEELVETWHDAANISDEVIETAKTMADSPIKWLFALAEMSILLAAMYVIGKGGLM